MFNDKYGLTDAVLEGRKTMTRRRIVPPRTMEGKDVYGFAVVKYPRTNQPIEVMALDADGAQIGNILPKYKVGEVVAVAQNLRDMGYDGREKDWARGNFWGLDHTPEWTNKMFVCASKCVHQIRITSVRIEQLRAISDDDCYAEGVQAVRTTDGCKYVAGGRRISDSERNRIWAGEIKISDKCAFNTPREAFAALIDKVSGRGTWENNPYVFVYSFELVK